MVTWYCEPYSKCHYGLTAVIFIMKEPRVDLEWGVPLLELFQIWFFITILHGGLRYVILHKNHIWNILYLKYIYYDNHIWNIFMQYPRPLFNPGEAVASPLTWNPGSALESPLALNGNSYTGKAIWYWNHLLMSSHDLCGVTLLKDQVLWSNCLPRSNMSKSAIKSAAILELQG